MVARTRSAALYDQPDRTPPKTATPATRFIPDQAILFRQHFPPRGDALSYWGGVPLVPRDFIWPSFTTPDGDKRALHFILQVDCAAIPEANRLGLPESGLLYIFVDLDWGNFWECRILHSAGDPRLFAPAAVPATLPPAYGDRGVWTWVQRDEDWPPLLPRWSFDPIVVTGTELPPPADEEEEDERKFWPGNIDLTTALAGIDGAIVESYYYSERRDSDGILVRPFANFPYDWHAVRIAMAEIDQRRSRDRILAYVKRGEMSQEDADAFMIGLKSAIQHWTGRAESADPLAPLTAAESDAVWQVFLDFQIAGELGLSRSVSQSINATLSANPDYDRVLPDEALALVRSSHAIGRRDKSGVGFNSPDHLLGPPLYVQGDAEERMGEWRLLFEMSSREQIGHFFGEGVYQFWIRPEDLAAGRFDRVVVDGSAY